ncbi:MULTISPECIES: ROK family protein [Paenibacillus]|uniref:ROK family protein n=1 Tax=Paenibacillus TaxID=44249 RepID=UPI000471749D|nr:MULTISPECIES: ROK family protein [Paenibacillus]AZH29712.1 ROK family protein [Paenibacillus sp. M-152]
MKNKILVFDIGGSFIKFSLYSQGEFMTKGKVATPLDSLENLLIALKQIHSQFIDECEGIAVSMPGIVDSVTGHMVHGGSLRYINDINIIEVFKKAFHLPVAIENDGKCAALGEVWRGSLQGIADGVVLVVGTGMGGGIISQGKLLKGHHLSAGEFSFIRTNNEHADNVDYLLGMQGSSSVLAKTVAKAKGLPADSITGEKVFKLIEEGDHTVQKIFREYCRNIATQIINLQTILDPEKFVIGGGISANPLLVVTIKEELEKLYLHSILNFVRADIEQSKLGNEANLLGAIYNYMQSQHLEV